MSYCRFSNDDYQCEVYCYEHVGGYFAVHVASNKPVFKDPLPEAVPFSMERMEEWVERRYKVMVMLETVERRPIGLPHDGETFAEPDAAACADRLESLKANGYNVPQYAIDALREEASES